MATPRRRVQSRPPQTKTTQSPPPSLAGAEEPPEADLVQEADLPPANPADDPTGPPEDAPDEVDDEQGEEAPAELEQPYQQPVTVVPPEGRILKVGEPDTFDAEDLGSVVRVNEPVYREVVTLRSKRPTYVLVHTAGEIIPKTALTKVPDPYSLP